MDSPEKVNIEILFLSWTKHPIEICFESIGHLMQISPFYDTKKL